MNADSSLDLLLRARNGDNGALDRLLARYLPRLRRWASGRLPAGARGMLDTGDIIQDAMVKALRHIDTIEIRSEGSLQAYLRRIIDNVICDAYRADCRHPVEAIGDDVPARDLSPLEVAVGAEAMGRYERALARLPEDDQLAIRLRVELQNSYREVAEALNKPSADAARMAVSRALVRLMHEMRVARDV
jgi:RNA polymerase sigma-70 factor (ECF subfamily)